MLLTSGQISMALSSGIVFVFTSLLFLSGYVLQQRTVRSIQEAIRPLAIPITTPSPHPRPSAAIPQAFGDPPGSPGHDAYQVALSQTEPSSPWEGVAYAQLVNDHASVCSSIILFAELERLRSRARRVLLYPREWHEDLEGQNITAQRQLETSRRLLGMAAAQYGVSLQAVVRENSDDAAAEYSISPLLSLTRYTQVLNPSTPGLLLDVEPLDSLLLADQNPGPIAANPSVTDPALLLYQPSSEISQQLRNSPISLNDISVLPNPTSTNVPLVISSFDLRKRSPNSRASSPLSGSAYFRFRDPDMPGPEYDVPWWQLMRAAPEDTEARRVWERAYGRFRQLRMDVCGLDLLPIVQTPGGASSEREIGDKLEE